MNNDLISREALKEAIENLIGYSLSYEAILNAIDNAPTVEIPVARWDCYCEGQKVGYEKALAERPQGEWKLHGMIYYCSVCGHDYEQGGNNFCGNCGAKMEGGAE